MLLAELTHFQQLIQRVTDQLDRMAGQHPGVTLLMTIPGVGPRTAEAIVAYIDNPHRFTRMRSVGSYFGLVPSQDQSAQPQSSGADHQNRSRHSKEAVDRGGVEFGQMV